MYYLLPFHFRTIGEHEILINEPGDYLIVPKGTAKKIVEKNISKDDELYKDLIAGWFISEEPIPALIDNLAVRLRTKKAFLTDFTALHIFVLTLRCNQNCIYCQASSRSANAENSDMTVQNLREAINLMMQTPAQDITMEFQGGEPTLLPEKIMYAVLYTKQLNEKLAKNITFVICSNCIDISEELLDFCVEHDIYFSISLDGSRYLHNHNRGKNDSFDRLQNGLERIRSRLGDDHVSPLMTTSEESFNYPREIINSYLHNGFEHIFIRPLNPYGTAKKLVDWSKYTDSFIQFYKKCLLYVIYKNITGHFMAEDFATIILRKILTPFSDGFVDMQSPAGIINSVIVYNYDGYVYASDESRMLAESGDYSFRLGPVSANYYNLFYGRRAQELSEIWCTECVAGCSDCAYQKYCGTDPVRNYVTQHDEYGYRPSSNLCKIHMAIIDFLFELLITRGKEVLPIFQSWIMGKEKCYD